MAANQLFCRVQRNWFVASSMNLHAMFSVSDPDALLKPMPPANLDEGMSHIYHFLYFIGIFNIWSIETSGFIPFL